jgi:hypothetical protein
MRWLPWLSIRSTLRRRPPWAAVFAQYIAVPGAVEDGIATCFKEGAAFRTSSFRGSMPSWPKIAGSP